MKQVYYFSLLLLVITAGCKKEQGFKNDTSIINNPTSYLVKRIAYHHPTGSLGLEYLFDYNATNNVVVVKQVQWWHTAINTPPVEWKSDTATYSFEYRNNLPVRCTVERNYNTWFYEYTYSGHLITQKTIKYSDGSIQGYTKYDYDSDGKLVEAVDSTDRVNFQHMFSYTNNLATKTSYTLSSTPQRKRKTEFSGYDNKVNFVKAINVLPPMFTWESLGIGFFETANNYATSTNYSEVAMDKDYEVPQTITFSYEYNDEGLPVKMYSSGSETVIEYQKYK